MFCIDDYNSLKDFESSMLGVGHRAPAYKIYSSDDGMNWKFECKISREVWVRRCVMFNNVRKICNFIKVVSPTRGYKVIPCGSLLHYVTYVKEV